MRTKRYVSGVIRSTLALSATFALVQSAQATLGEKGDSFERDRQSLNAIRKQDAQKENYTIQEMNSGPNKVREYISTDGIYFAISWDGVRHPDLTPLLGKYSDDFKQAKETKKKEFGRRNQFIQGSRVVVQTWQRTRGVGGRAYDPDLIPKGVDIHEIK